MKATFGRNWLTLRSLGNRPLIAEYFLLAGIILLALAYRLGLGPWPVDDAFITYRYAYNLAHGNGFVYNVGERVLGTTAPLYGIVLGIASFAGADIQLTSFWINLSADIGTIVMVYSLCTWLRLQLLGLLTALLIAVSSEYSYYAVSGMETSLYIFIMQCVFWSTLRQRWTLMAVAAATLILIRIDGVICVTAVATILVIHHQWTGWKPLVLFAAILLPWIAFTLLYYGSPFPQSAIAKGAAGMSSDRWISAENYISYFTNNAGVNTGADKGLLFACLALLGIVVIVRERRFEGLTLVLLWGLLYSLVFIVANVFTYFMWYFIPLYPVYYVCMLIGFIKLFEAAGIERAWRRIQLHGPALAARGVQLGLVLVLLATTALSLPARVASHYQALVRWTEGREGAYRLIAEMIVRQSSSASTVGANEIGVLGYFTRRTMVDAGGLVSLNTVGKDSLHVVKEYQPEWWVALVSEMSPVVSDPWFWQTYQLAPNRMDRGQGIEVFRKKSNPPTGSP
ncbi:MAG: hypothetical protein HZB53_14170 [Chloroflexi bacterium]|nr:hypothetical protein [Chloroflexota bacterium]